MSIEHLHEVSIRLPDGLDWELIEGLVSFFRRNLGERPGFRQSATIRHSEGQLQLRGASISDARAEVETGGLDVRQVYLTFHAREPDLEISVIFDHPFTNNVAIFRGRREAEVRGLAATLSNALARGTLSERQPASQDPVRESGLVVPTSWIRRVLRNIWFVSIVSGLVVAAIIYLVTRIS